MEYEITERAIKIFLDDKHVKSLPKILLPAIKKIDAEMVIRLNLKKKSIR